MNDVLVLICIFVTVVTAVGLFAWSIHITLKKEAEAEVQKRLRMEERALERLKRMNEEEPLFAVQIHLLSDDLGIVLHHMGHTCYVREMFGLNIVSHTSYERCHSYIANSYEKGFFKDGDVTFPVRMVKAVYVVGMGLKK